MCAFCAPPNVENHSREHVFRRSATLRYDAPLSEIFAALALASGRILFFALRHGPKPLMVDYRTGDVWLYDESAGK